MDLKESRRNERNYLLAGCSLIALLSYGAINRLSDGAISTFFHSMVSGVAKLGAAKVFGGLGIGLLGWQADAVVGAALLAYGLYRGYKRYQYKRMLEKPKTEVVVTEDLNQRLLTTELKS